MLASPLPNTNPRKGRDVMLFFLVWPASFTLISLIQETQTDFQDLGKLLLGGVVAAVGIAIAFTVIRLKLRDKRPQTSPFISIATKVEED